jgi:negative regulator of flagellin synthesis FlgM
VKIEDSLKSAGSVGVSTTQARGSKNTEKAAPVSPSSANVQLSPQVQALAGKSSTNAVFDAKKVEEIKAAIASGRFQVDPEKVADGLLESVSDLISSRSKG